MGHLFGEIQSFHGFVKKPGRKNCASADFPGLNLERSVGRGIIVQDIGFTELYR